MTKLSNVILDCDFVDDPKIQSLIDKFGEVAIGRYIRILTALARQGGAMSYEQSHSLGRAISVTREAFKEFIDSCIELDLIQRNDGEIFIPRLQADAERLEKKRESWRSYKDSTKIPVGVQKETKKNPKRIRKDSMKCSYDPEDEYEHEKENELIKKEIAIRPEPLERWIAYRKERKQPITQRSIEQIQKTYGGRLGDLERDVSHSIQNGYQGLFAPKENSTSPPKQRHAQNVINNQRTIETYKKFKKLEELENANNGNVENLIEGLFELPPPRTR